MTRLLILMCSARKIDHAEMLPAYERYNGPQWQIVRNALATHPALMADLDIYVLSAAFGLIPATQPIPFYDQRMDAERADALQAETQQRFRQVLDERPYTACCLGLSKVYLQAFGVWETIVPESIHMTVTRGPMGEKLRQIRAWIFEEPLEETIPPDRLVADANPRGYATVAGVTVQYTREEVLSVVREGLRTQATGIHNYRGWYVLVDDQPIAPKWLMSQLIGRAPTTFNAADARRGLLALGISIERVQDEA